MFVYFVFRLSSLYSDNSIRLLSVFFYFPFIYSSRQRMDDIVVEQKVTRHFFPSLVSIKCNQQSFIDLNVQNALHNIGKIEQNSNKKLNFSLNQSI